MAEGTTMETHLPYTMECMERLESLGDKMEDEEIMDIFPEKLATLNEAGSLTASEAFRWVVGRTWMARDIRMAAKKEQSKSKLVSWTTVWLESRV
ncbi:hypothetical protein R1sor_022235 [Riccia sorocarpa]|uniref:Uncharacterized protein n=1 Tax=Riccia sorocarpa TaxID=122646 RepID=A0ABD3GQ39_9MARC